MTEITIPDENDKRPEEAVAEIGAEAPSAPQPPQKDPSPLQPAIEEVKAGLLDLARWLLDRFGEDVFQHLRDNAYIQVDFSEETPLDQWLVNCIMTLFSEEDQSVIADRFRSHVQNADNPEPAPAADEGRVRELEARVDDLARRNQELEAKLRESVRLQAVLKIILGPLSLPPALPPLIRQSLAPGAREQDRLFWVHFCRGWILVGEAMKRSKKMEEEQKVQELDKALTALLTHISDQRNPNRRPALDAAADTVNGLLSQTVFVSPEKHLKLNPQIHNVENNRGSEVVEGLSFAIFTPGADQARRPAEVKTR